ncbi:MAG: aldo/keto reductase [Rhodospirillaceae bacterium]|nr:aldo/keto reductase [Rhodospirillaceae bacterium]
MRTVRLPSGRGMPVLGLGTWRMGESARDAGAEADALTHGLDLGLRLIDTAEMYGEGGAERVVARAVAGRRDDVFIVSKVYPHNASRKGAVAACERSLKRLGTDRIDLYLLHWRGSIPLAETFEAFQALRTAGKILDFGVSNFDGADLEDARSHDGGLMAANQVYYNLARREAEAQVLPWCRQYAVPVMAYSPFDQGSLLAHPALRRIADRHGATPAMVAVAWLLRDPDIVAIPKSSRREGVREIHAAYGLTLADSDLRELDETFAPPRNGARLPIV